MSLQQILGGVKPVVQPQLFVTNICPVKLAKITPIEGKYSECVHEGDTCLWGSEEGITIIGLQY